MLGILTGCSNKEVREEKIVADRVYLQRAAALEMLHDYLRQVAEGGTGALRFPFYCVQVANQQGKIEVDDQFLNALRSDLPEEMGAEFARASDCQMVNQIYHLPSGKAANTLIAKWNKDAGPREYWQAGAMGPGGLAGGGHTYWVTLAPEGPAIERHSRWVVF